MINWLRSRVSIGWLKAAISAAAIGVIILRLRYPELKIDAITFGLILVAILPWLSELIESAKFPGGWEIKFRDLRNAGAKVTGDTAPNMGASALPGTHSFVVVADHDPNLALVGLRIEIEKRLREYAERHELDSRRPLTQLMRELMQRGALPQDMAGGLRELIQAGNSAAHGARVQQGIADWAIDVGPKILQALDERLK